MPLTIIDRKTWGARASTETAKDAQMLSKKASSVWFSSTRCKPCTTKDSCMKAVKDIQTVQMDVIKLPDIAFSFVIDGLGNVYRGRGWSLAPKLPFNYSVLNAVSIYIGYIGSYTAKDLPEIMSKTAKELIEDGISKKIIREDYIHNNMFAPNLYFQEYISL